MIFLRIQYKLASAVKPGVSVQFPDEPLDEKCSKDRCSFTAHLDTSRLHFQSSMCALIRATSQALWLLKSDSHDTVRTWLGLKAPQDVTIAQATFYGDQQGYHSKNIRRIVVLVKQGGGALEMDEVAEV